MKCLECDSAQPLKPAKLEPTLAAASCVDCGGTLLSLVAYRLWRERHGGLPQAPAPESLAAVPEEPGRAFVCRRCGHIMLRFRYTNDTRRMLDVCLNCEDVWLQRNEWAYLKSRELSGVLPRIFTNPWQRRLRQEWRRTTSTQDWDARLGGVSVADH